MSVSNPAPLIREPPRCLGFPSITEAHHQPKYPNTSSLQQYPELKSPYIIMVGDPTSPVRLRQVALVVHDLARARQEITEILGVPVTFEDPAVGQWGLENFLVPIGGDIIEVVAPTRPGTTAGRLLEKRGEGGYMIIMQNKDADATRKKIEAAGTSKVIFSHAVSKSYPSWGGVKDEGFCIQYHPKGFKGGMMPELDSHTPCEKNPEPLTERFSPWHACGSEYDRYVLDMKKTSHLHLLGCNLSLGRRDTDVEGAAQQWSNAFDIPISYDHLVFANAQIGFSPGQEGHSEGLLYISIAVSDDKRMKGILDRARAVGKIVHTPGDWFEMAGVRWNFVSWESINRGAASCQRTRTARL